MSAATTTPSAHSSSSVQDGCFIVGQVIGLAKLQEGIGKTSQKPYKFVKFRVLAGDQIAEITQSYKEDDKVSIPVPGTRVMFKISGDYKQHDMVVVSGTYTGPV